jgi:hypothetical protein
MNDSDDRQRTPDPRLILLGSLVALLAGIGALVVVVLLGQQVL